jgi:transposase-like protein
MHGMRRQHDAAVKAKLALEAIKLEKTIAEIAGEYGIHPNQIRMWRDRTLASSARSFFQGCGKEQEGPCGTRGRIFSADRPAQG